MHKALGENGPLIKTPLKAADKTHFNYVQPDEVILGYNGRGQKRHYHYIPVPESIRAMLKEKSGARQSLNPHLFDDDTLYDFIDLHIIRSNSLFSPDPNSLKVMLVQDTFEIVNPLVSAQQTQNVLAVYLTLGNFSPHL